MIKRIAQIFESRGDGLDFARGMLVAIPAGCILWGVIFAIGYALYKIFS